MSIQSITAMGLLLLTSFVVTAAAEDAPPKPLQVLLIGNSQCPTIVGNQLLEKLAASDKGARPIQVGGCVKGGASLKSHWEAGTGPETARGKIAAGGWDFVVLQDIYFVEAEAFQPYARKFHELIKEHKAQTVLFGTASILSDYPKGFERLHRLHVAMGKELEVPIVDASQAYFRYFGDKPTPELMESLFAKDRAHPGLQGSYLYSGGIYSVLTGRTAVGLAAPAAIPADVAKSLQETAWAQYQATAAELAADEPIVIGKSAKGHVHPSICRTKDGTLIVVFKGNNVLLCTRSRDGGQTWTPAAEIATSAKRPEVIREVKTFEVYPGTADVLPDDRVVVTWNYIADDKANDGYYERALLYSISSDQGKTWSEQALIGPVAGKHLGAVRHNVLPWSDGRWLLPLRVGPPRLFHPESKELEVFALTGPDKKQHSFQQIIRTPKGTLLAMGPVMLRSTDEGQSWETVNGFRAVPDIDTAEGRYLTVLRDGRILVTFGVGTTNKGLSYNFSADDGLTWNNDHTAVLLPDQSIAARYYSARTVQLDDQHLGTVFVSGGVQFLRVKVDRVAK
jgi:hypothetical protein